ncbi:hypothetical protein FNF27_00303 [Cafeteria roenbergensis]|uniref:Prefoldin subunit 2 n=2 Tax=Cafeteria roenbergensis TaxID=33653 RepID=A0A5A8E1W3_CAFRO|nr:hypothetical protein FNF29_01437 [Cafeteria roenbergensis]KAA0163586.1 hypothetical protein FNF31_02748 [Cafeteria roenbergensis]KAA0171773.1 hypothetical protein FNF28_00409 [Cafeteria roenbergensis]KAA0178454.1 hypothetical protein FNF27_00303 [Cafeteria roenbergensis]|eukprot:KAA0156019.1 hypothetical protein FNF29_01437 [Cafeteria roenbergensis]
MAATTTAPPEVAAEWRAMRQKEQMLIQRLTELEQTQREHVVVKDALEKLPAERNCYQLIGGTLVPKTVEGVLPQVSATLTNLTSVVAGLREELEKAAAARGAFESKHRIKPSGSPAAAAPAASSGAATPGVLA